MTAQKIRFEVNLLGKQFLFKIADLPNETDSTTDKIRVAIGSFMTAPSVSPYMGDFMNMIFRRKNELQDVQEADHDDESGRDGVLLTELREGQAERGGSQPEGDQAPSVGFRVTRSPA